VRAPEPERQGRPAGLISAFVRRNALAISLTALVAAALTANVAPQVIEILLQALGLRALGPGVATLLVHLTEGLVILLLLALYVEQRPFRSVERGLGRLRVEMGSRLTEVHDQLGAQLTQLHMDHLREHILRRQLRDLLVEHFDTLGNLLDLVLPQAVNPVLKAQIVIRLVSPDRGDEVVHDYQGQFSIRQNEYIIGIVSSKGHADRLTDANAPIHQVFVLPETDQMHTLTAEQAVQRYRVRLQYLEERTSLWVDAHPEPVAQPQRIWNPEHAEDRFPLTLLRLALPAEPAVRQRQVRLTYQFPVSLRDGFSFWFATRPIYVERIEVDASRLRGVENLKFERFLPNFDRTTTSDLVTDRVFRVTVENWILKGHGVILCWQHVPDARPS
jgi:hypothetical protein